LREALRLSEEASDMFLVGHCLHLLGRLSGYAGEYAVSNDYLLRSRAHAQRYGDLYRVFMANRNLARNHVAMKAYRNALEFSALAVTERVNANETVGVRIILGIAIAG
jgi:hypothetical protein